MFKMELRGEKKLLETLRQLKIDGAKAMAGALIAGALPVVNAAKDKAPYKTGNLMRSYHVGTKTRDITAPQATDGAPQIPAAGAVTSLASELERGRKAEVLVGTDVVYAPPQEFLHKPHLRPALEENRDKVNAEAKRAIQSMIKNAERRAA
jgi:Bacteriophage HK97-gp10, putative tail-component